MAAGPAVFLDMDMSGAGAYSWQLAKTPNDVQTAVTAAKLSQALRDV